MTCHYLEPKGLSRKVLEAHLPLGVAWESFRVVGKVAYRLMGALANVYEDAWAALCRMATELDPRTTVEMIDEWERAVSLPDSCLPAATSIDERRAWVMWRLEKRRWTTAQDWKDLAALFGITITITPGWVVQKPALYPTCYPVYYRLFPKLGRFRVYIDITDGCDIGGYPYHYPVVYGFGARCADFMCLIDRVRPANVIVIWNDTPPISC